jgi:hypothetical protein
MAVGPGADPGHTRPAPSELIQGCGYLMCGSSFAVHPARSGASARRSLAGARRINGGPAGGQRRLEEGLPQCPLT